VLGGRAIRYRVCLTVFVYLVIMEEIIRLQLNELEISENICIVYACESGSRAWGFPSIDSDYDVRLIYVRPLAWYLSIDEKRDVVECSSRESLDITGWDLKKALQLFRKSNPPLLEWLGSPIIYLEKTTVAARMRELSEDYYSPTACLYHYLHMARGNFREYLKGDEVWVKKYFYVLRPLLAMIWIEKGLGVIPTDFKILVNQIVTEHTLKREIEYLISAKRDGAELDRGPRIPPISEFIERELERWEQHEIENNYRTPSSEKLDLLFRNALSEVWET
jgi:predicted nucleotidyltransferase